MLVIIAIIAFLVVDAKIDISGAIKDAIHGRRKTEN